MTAPVFTAPESAEDATRMRGALAVAARAFHLTPSGPEVWEWQGRTLGRRVGTSRLRVVSALSEKAGGRLGGGTALADASVPWMVPRPGLRDLMDWTHGSYAYRAELTKFITTPTVVAGSPVLDRDPNLPDIWWRDLRGAARALAAVPTGREAVGQSWIDRNFRSFLGVDPPRIYEHSARPSSRRT
ncbi:hypothetical protein ACFWN1_27810 [Streptomyces sp. NPDC058459]|uniref:hypothetical protein n=1 Tax=Streptomyces sp. NPDC058459 TaxID=3346508 RepID=UPI003654B853